MADDVRLNKIAIIERCLKRAEEEYRGHELEFRSNFTRQDSIILNLLRACEASVDLAMHLVRTKKLGLPQESREAFTLLERSGLLSEELATRMRAMVGFRNIAVHDYQKLSLDVVTSILDKHLNDFRRYTAVVLQSDNNT
ncbi:MAG: type VII toxin-antitoxin system HepT family RNase toxin [Sulfuricaulis sp.]